MTMLLALSHVAASRTRGRRRETVLRDVSLELDAGDCVAVLGHRRADRRMLLEICAGMEPVAAGSVVFDGRTVVADELLGKPGGIARCNTSWGAAYGNVLGQVSMPAIRTARSIAEAELAAHDMLERVGARSLALEEPENLEGPEVIRVALARALITRPRLLLVDAPTEGLTAPRRDDVLGLLRSLADRERLGVLMTVDEAAGLTGRAHRTLALHDGELRGTVAPRPAAVVELHARRADSSA